MCTSSVQHLSTISKCYATGDIISGITIDYGGLCGENWGGTITESYFLDTGRDNGFGEPLTDAQMKQQSSFVNWNFEYIWSVDEGTSYPILSVQVIEGDLVLPYGVDFVDFALFAEQWFEPVCDGTNNNCKGADFDGINRVDLGDLQKLCEHWLEGTGP